MIWLFDDISITSDAIEQFKSGARQYAELAFDIPGEEHSITLTEKNIKMHGLSIEMMSITGNEFELGTMCSSMVNIKLDRESKVEIGNNPHKIDDFVYNGAKVDVSIGVYVGNSIEYCKFGKYKIDEVEVSKDVITLVGLDSMMDFNKPCNTNNNLIFHEGDTISNAIKSICQHCNVTVETEDLRNLINRLTVIENIPEGIKNMSCRQVLMQLLALNGCSGRFDSNGKFRITPYVYDDTRITKGDRYSSKLSESSIEITGIRLINARGDISSAGNTGEDSYTIEIQNDFITSSSQTVVNQLWSYLSEEYYGVYNTNYLPYSATTVSLPHIRPLNKIYIDDVNGNPKGTIITNYLFQLNNSTKLEAKGISKIQKSYGKRPDLTRAQTRIVQQTVANINPETSSAAKKFDEFNKVVTGAMGLYNTYEDGIWYFHDKATLNDSKYIFTMKAGVMAWTNSGWNSGAPKWEYGVESTGEAFFKKVLAGGVEIGKEGTSYKTTIEPERFTISQEVDGGNGSIISNRITEINEGRMDIARVNIESYLNIGVFRIVPNSTGLDVIYTK